MNGLMNKLRMMDAAPVKPAKAAADPLRDSVCFQTQAVYPLSAFCDRRHMTPQVLQSIYGISFPASLKPEEILFLDTETTGLSGGVGTIAFEVGLGYFTETGFAVEQLLMRDYPQESDMLARLSARMRRFSVLCTFNGRTFDAPLLKSRYIMNRLSDDCFPDVHADVLYPARRLWKLRLKQCSLAALEADLLGVRREDDLPGAQVPQTYFQYLKDGNFQPLEKVLEHNRQDIVSLAQLFFVLCKLTDRPEEIQADQDMFSLARTLERQGDRQKAMKCYRLCAGGDMRGAAYQAMVLSQKREGNLRAAEKLCQAMARQGDEPVFAYETLAKLYEHQLHDPETALHYTRQALLLLAEPALGKTQAVQDRQIALQYRYARLRRKLDKAPSVT